MITVLTRIRSVPERYRARMRDIVRAYTLVNERDEDWVDDFYAHRLARCGLAATRAGEIAPTNVWSDLPLSGAGWRPRAFAATPTSGLRPRADASR